MKQSQSKKFDQQVKNTLENVSVEPPAFLWNAIESKLPPNNAWYSKYKYVLLLLLLVFTSASSIYVYKHIVLGNKGSHVALNKRLLKDETDPNAGNAVNLSGSTASVNHNSGSIGQLANALSDKDKSDNGNTASVSSFYRTDKNDVKNESALYAAQKATAAEKKAIRLKRLEVQGDAGKSDMDKQEVLAISKQEKASSLSIVALIASEKGSEKSTTDAVSGSSKSSKGNSTDAETAFSDKTVKADADTYDNSNENSGAIEAFITADNTTEKQFPLAADQDITQPVSEPIRGTAAEPLTASVVPVKVQQSPIASRDVLRSMITPEKLEKLDIESQAAGITDLNPNKEKFLRNLKQFAGYDINKGFHIGAFISINNVWLNKKEFSADENTSSIRPKVQFGKAYGLNIGYDYTARWGIELESQISEQGQKYSMKQINAGNNGVKDVNLLYLKLPLMMKYKQTFINNYNSKPIALSFLFGPQVGILLKKKVIMDGNELKETPEYNKTEFGIAGGFDFDLFMTRNLALTIGGRTGFASSFKKGQPMSFQLGVTTQLNFRFPRKIK